MLGRGSAKHAKKEAERERKARAKPDLSLEEEIEMRKQLAEIDANMKRMKKEEYKKANPSAYLEVLEIGQQLREAELQKESETETMQLQLEEAKNGLRKHASCWMTFIGDELELLCDELPAFTKPTSTLAIVANLVKAPSKLLNSARDNNDALIEAEAEHTRKEAERIHSFLVLKAREIQKRLEAAGSNSVLHRDIVRC